jgi:beta-glucosidase-like glycosyl hydrolase
MYHDIVPGEDPTLTSHYTNAFVTGLQHLQEDDEQAAYHHHHHHQEEQEASSSSSSSSLLLSTTTTTPLSFLTVAAGCKHFVANSLERWGNVTRHDVNAQVSIEELYNYYFPPFEECVTHAHTVGIMCSYNAVNGIPACVNDWLLQDVLRRDWKFGHEDNDNDDHDDHDHEDASHANFGLGYVVTDCGALRDVLEGHHYATSPAEVAALAMNASVDVNCGNGDYYPQALLEAYQLKLVQETTIRDSFTRLAKIQFRLGLFDSHKKNQKKDHLSHDGPLTTRPDETFPIPDIPNLIDTPADQALAYRAAQQSIVVLQNKNSILPLLPLTTTSGGRKIAVIGPHALCQRELLSNYHGQKCPSVYDKDKDNDVIVVDCTNATNHDNDACYTCLETPFHAIQEWNRRQGGGVNATTRYKVGCHVDTNPNNPDDKDFDEIDDAVALAKESDLVILLMGLNQAQEREDHDRTLTTLPGLQRELIQRVVQVMSNKTSTTTGTRTTTSPEASSSSSLQVILVLVHGGSLSLGPEILDTVPAIVSASYGGQAASRALADVLFGQYNPTGKLAATMYPPMYIHELPLTEMSIIKAPGRTYQYYQGQAEFDFGHGLSYSQWNLEWARPGGGCYVGRNGGLEEGEEEVLNDLAHDHRSEADADWYLELPTEYSNGLTKKKRKRNSQGKNVDQGCNNKEHVTISVQVENLGPYPGHQTVLLFWKPVTVKVPPHVTLPFQKLIHFGGTSSTTNSPTNDNSTPSPSSSLYSSSRSALPLQVHEVATLSWNVTLWDFVHWYNGHQDVDPYDGKNSRMAAMVYPGVYELQARAANQVWIAGQLIIHTPPVHHQATATARTRLT